MPIAVIGSLIAFQLLLIFVHLAVYATLAAAFGISGPFFEWLFIILAVTFISASFLSHFFRSKLLDWYYTFSAYWFGLVHFLFMGSVAFYFTLFIFYHNNVYVSPALVGAIAFGIFFLIHLYGTFNSWRAEVVYISIPLSKTPGFDRAFWSDKTIAFVSDVHLGNVRHDAFLARIVKKLQAAAPEAVFIGGDLFDGTACDEARMVEPLRSLKPPGGVYFVTGNHEFYLPSVERALAAIRAVGVRILNNEKTAIGGIDFVGVDYQATNKPDPFKKILGTIGIDRSRPNILIKHEPKDLDVAESAGISLGFFGHTHQGQIFPLSLFTKQIYKGFDYGLKPHGALQVYTSSGVGTWGPPLRLGTKSEIVIVKFV